MAISDAGTPTFSIGRVVSGTAGAIGRNLAPFVVLTLIAALPQTLLITYLGQAMTAPGGPVNPAFLFSGAFWLKFVVVEVVTIVFMFVLQAALTYATVMDLSGK